MPYLIWIFVVALALAAVPARAQNSPQFLYYFGRSGLVLGFSIDNSTGSLTPITSARTVREPWSATADPSGKFLYVGASTGHSGSAAYLQTLRIDSSNGALSPLPALSFPRQGVGFEAVDSTGRFVYFSIGPGGKSDQTLTFTLDGILGSLTPAGRPLRVKGIPFAHPSAPYLFLLLPGALGVYQIDDTTGELTHMSGASVPQLVSINLNPANNLLYAPAYGGKGIYVFSFANGALTPISGSPFSVPTNAQIDGFALDASGRFLYDIDYRHHTVDGYLLDAATGGLLAPVPGSPFSTGGRPTQITADRTGKFLYVGGAAGKQALTTYSIDSASGTLTRLNVTSIGSDPSALITLSPSTAALPSLLSLQVTPAQGKVHSSGFGKEVQFTAVGQYSDGSSHFLTGTATWSSSDPSVATIGNGPVVAGQAVTNGAGGCTVSATVGSLTATADLSVTQPALIALAITPATGDIWAGTSIQFTATGTYADGTRQNVSAMSAWSSSSPGVAMVNSAGIATGLQQGSTTISATLGGLKVAATLNVL